MLTNSSYQQLYKSALVEMLRQTLRCETCDKIVDDVWAADVLIDRDAVMVYLRCHNQDIKIEINKHDLYQFRTEYRKQQVLSEWKDRPRVEKPRERIEPVSPQETSSQKNPQREDKRLVPVLPAKLPREYKNPLSSRRKETKVQKSSQKIVAPFLDDGSVSLWARVRKFLGA